ncbi:MAG: hypothetical protein AAF641_04330 [Pseudomonadota bacterium]
MSINTMTPIVILGQPVYNPETGAFEAKAQVQDGGAVFYYSASLPAAPHAAFEFIMRGLTAQVFKQHGHGRDRTWRFLRDALRRSNTPALGGLLAA